MPRITYGLLAAGILCTIASTGVQAADPAVVCESGKLKVAGKYEDCRLKAEDCEQRDAQQRQGCDA